MTSRLLSGKLFFTALKLQKKENFHETAEKIEIISGNIEKRRTDKRFQPPGFSIPFITSTMMFLSANFLPIFSPRRYCLSCSCS